MSKVYFMNNGDFDIRAMMTMGVSAKDNDEAIGFFGTGFKYAVAIVLRLGGSIKVSTVSGMFEFTAKREEIRGKEFGVVYVNNQPAGFTTRMGINWEPWMAFRELYCNAKDEGGVIADRIDPKYDTVIEVDCQEIFRAFTQQKDYFIDGEPLLDTGGVQVFKGGKPFIYYRGVAVRNAVDNQLFSYNITSTVDLTEDRTAKHDYQLFWPIQRTWQNHCSDKAMLRKVLRGGEHGEAKIGFDPNWRASDAFLEVCGELMKSDAGVCESARVVASKVEAIKGDWPEFEMTDVQRKMLDKAVSHLAKIDVSVTMFPIKTVSGLGDGVMGRALDGVIYLSELPFQMGTKQLASTLMEEWVHNKLGCADFDRKMQNWLFDKILSLSEDINGEPI